MQKPEFLITDDLSRYVKLRPHETKVGQAMNGLPSGSYSEALDKAWELGQRVALVGVPESIGVKGNLGRPGAEGGWQAFLGSFANLQHTGLLSTHELLLVGSVDCSDLMSQAEPLDANNEHDLQTIRQLVERVDARVREVVEPLFVRGFEVVLVGGGHNNAYPLLKSLSTAKQQPCGAINLDPHADFRAREGRHSGNGFSYAYVDGALSHYHVVGLHQAKNSASSLRQMADAGMRYHAIHSIIGRPFAEVMDEVAAKSVSWQRPLGIEVDVDCLTGVPASAVNYSGLNLAQGFSFVKRLAELEDAAYLHLAEAAPSLCPTGFDEGQKQTGQVLTELVIAYMLGRERRRRTNA
ncbi:MAG: formimidoylglutamase [Pseudomonadota bacterium]|nr:formimidoylglutamase [Pseudomonadota bacterium]